ncbi:acyl dehydratase [Povalibacter uvarum]|uniref:Acyl dehydratase n=1 Tax=Povalibacter uvarum TaxID=732238 RepID=A0A841HR38_9GAMM|nr:MaoC family dehydratase [Povalibacter uvarum]MBB6095821.1 acyl dehydratase [Povalibacter uvarum]
MKELRFDELTVGDELPALPLSPITRTTLALYAGASGDHNPIHIDLDFARQAGMSDVFAHGMLSAAYLGRFLTGWVRQERIREIKLRFTGITHLQDAPLCSGRIAEKFEHAGEERVRIELKTTVRGNIDTIVGEAVLALK